MNSILLDIDLGEGRKGLIDVTTDSNPIVSQPRLSHSVSDATVQDLAYQFIYQYALNPDYVYPLIDYISKTKARPSLLPTPLPPSCDSLCLS
jgi:hypothetical protein